MKMTEREHIGYTEREEGFYKLYAPVKGSIVTQAFILCKYCRGSIYHCMGPRYDAVCLTCYEKEPDERLDSNYDTTGKFFKNYVSTSEKKFPNK
jgi:hypothetical protein